MLAQRAASEGPRWTRAVEDPSAPIPKEVARDLRRIGGSQTVLLARRTRTIRMCSLGQATRLGASRAGG